MSFLTWLRTRNSFAPRRTRTARCGNASTRCLAVEALEDRCLLSGWAVSNSGGGTFTNFSPAISPPDAAGDIYVTGSFSGTATFGSTTLSAAPYSLPAPGDPP